jgi:2-polyprenyl-3-methyl-5-hydroxy-6-metoxy-1,4-benzoquinol methylase
VSVKIDQPSTVGEYDESMQALLQLVWGEGFLSPGGTDEVAGLLGGSDISGCAVLDIGCGLGAIDQLLVARHGAASVVGIDIDPALLAQMNVRIARRTRRSHPESVRGAGSAAVCGR